MPAAGIKSGPGTTYNTRPGFGRLKNLGPWVPGPFFFWTAQECGPGRVSSAGYPVPKGKRGPVYGGEGVPWITDLAGYPPPGTLTSQILPQTPSPDPFLTCIECLARGGQTSMTRQSKRKQLVKLKTPHHSPAIPHFCLVSGTGSACPPACHTFVVRKKIELTT